MIGITFVPPTATVVIVKLMRARPQAYTGLVILWAIAGAALFIVAAVASERHALLLPAAVLLAAGLASVLS